MWKTVDSSLTFTRVASKGVNVNFRKTPDSSKTDNIIGTVKHKQYVELVLDKNQKPIKQNNFYQVKVNNTVGWVSASFIVQELNK